MEAPYTEQYHVKKHIEGELDAVDYWHLNPHSSPDFADDELVRYEFKQLFKQQKKIVNSFEALNLNALLAYQNVFILELPYKELWKCAIHERLPG